MSAEGQFIDREFQRSLLLKLAAKYPDYASPAEIGFHPGDHEARRTVAYLAEHGLLRVIAEVPREHSAYGHCALTAKGLDFLQDDGGLTAILGVVTVRLEAETLRTLIAQRIEQSAASADEKKRAKSWVTQAGEEALAEAVRRMVGAAIDRVPNALTLLQGLPGAA